MKEMKKIMESMMGAMSKEEMEKMVEQCLVFSRCTGEKKEKECAGKKTEESASLRI